MQINTAINLRFAFSNLLSPPPSSFLLPSPVHFSKWKYITCVGKTSSLVSTEIDQKRKAQTQNDEEEAFI